MKFRILITALAIGVAGNASAELITFSETVLDTDYASAGVGGLRGNGFGDITLSGTSGTITQAYLYWHGPTNSADPGFNANLTMNGTAVVGDNIGFSDDNFWGQDNSQAYRADVTSLVSGDGTYSLAGLQAAHSNGASLVVFYDDGDDSNNIDVVNFQGNDANFSNVFDPDGWDITLSGIDYTSGDAFLSMSVSDGQTFNDGSFFLNGVDIGAIFNGDTVSNTPGSSVTNGGLWDIVNIDITSFLTVGMNTLNLTHTALNDALSAIHFAVLLPEGSAPTTDVPEPGTLALLGIGLLGMGAARRRKKT